jgi:hypothetical protein
MSLTRQIYKMLRIRNDLNAVRRGKIGQRLARRAYGRSTGRLARRMFR